VLGLCRFERIGEVRWSLQDVTLMDTAAINDGIDVVVDW